jgi:hypothetical protein
VSQRRISSPWVRPRGSTTLAKVLTVFQVLEDKLFRQHRFIGGWAGTTGQLGLSLVAIADTQTLQLILGFDAFGGRDHLSDSQRL